MIFYPRKLILIAYIIIPFVLYSILIFATLLIGDLPVHWYITMHIDTSTLLSIYSKHLVLGLPVALMCPERIDTKKQKSIFFSMLGTILFVLYAFVEISYLRSLCFLFLIIIIANKGIRRRQLIVFICVGLLSLFLGGDRFTVVIPILILMVTFNLSFWQYFIYGSIFLIILIFVLTPIKANVPISDFIQYNGIFYLWYHLQPIVLAAAYFDSVQLEIGKSFSEMIPFGKSIFEYSGSIKSARALFTSEGFSGDFGSNSSINILEVCFIFGCITFAFLNIKDKRLRAILYLYFVCLAPYFIRRDFANFINECLVLMVLGILIWMIYKIIPKQGATNKYSNQRR